jgi:hypothetical protein
MFFAEGAMARRREWVPVVTAESAQRNDLRIPVRDVDGQRQIKGTVAKHLLRRNWCCTTSYGSSRVGDARDRSLGFVRHRRGVPVAYSEQQRGSKWLPTEF